MQKFDNIEDALLVLHERSMNKDSSIAAEARAQRAVVNMMSVWLDEESSHRTPPPELIMAFLSAAVSGMAMTTLTAVQGDARTAASAMRSMREVWLQQFDRYERAFRAEGGRTQS